MVKGWTPISVKDEVKEKLEEIYKNDKRRPKNQRFTPYVENLLIELIDYERTVNEYGHVLSLENVNDNHIILMDNFTGKHIFVYFQGKGLYCEEHDGSTCYHTGFCYALPNVYKALIAKGLRPKMLMGYTKLDKMTERTATTTVSKKKGEHDHQYTWGHDGSKVTHEDLERLKGGDRTTTTTVIKK